MPEIFKRLRVNDWTEADGKCRKETAALWREITKSSLMVA